MSSARLVDGLEEDPVEERLRLENETARPRLAMDQHAHAAAFPLRFVADGVPRTTGPSGLEMSTIYRVGPPASSMTVAPHVIPCT
jgi:hypothetical protein